MDKEMQAQSQKNRTFFNALFSARRKAKKLIEMLNTVGDYYETHLDDIDPVTTKDLRDLEKELEKLTVKIGVDA